MKMRCIQYYFLIGCLCTGIVALYCPALNAQHNREFQLGQVSMATKYFYDEDILRIRQLPKFLYSIAVKNGFKAVLMKLGIAGVTIRNTKYQGTHLTAYESREHIMLLEKFYDNYGIMDDEFLQEICKENQLNLLVLWTRMAPIEIESNPIVLELMIFDSPNNATKTSFITIDKTVWNNSKQRHMEQIIQDIVEIVTTIKYVLYQQGGE